MSHLARLDPTVRPSRAAATSRQDQPAAAARLPLGVASLALALLGACSNGALISPATSPVTSVQTSPAVSAAATPVAAASTVAAGAATVASKAPGTRVHNPAPRTGPGGSTYGAKHGGLVLSENGTQVELDAQPDQLDVYVEKDGKPVDLTGATGHITLLNGVDITDAYLDPSADKQRLTIRGSYKLVHGTRVVTRVTLPGQPQLTLRYLIVMLPSKPAAAASAAAASR